MYKCNKCGKDFEKGSSYRGHRGNRLSKEIRLKKHSETLKRRFASGEISPWNKGLNKESDSRVQRISETESKTKKEIFNSEKGSDIRKKLSLNSYFRGKSLRKGIKWTVNERQLISQKTKESMREKGYKRTPEEMVLRMRQDYFDWRKDVYERDKYTCLKCKKVGGILTSHHLFSFHDFPEERLKVNNGATLCLNDHKDFHRMFGRNKNSPEQFYKFLQQ